MHRKTYPNQDLSIVPLNKNKKIENTKIMYIFRTGERRQRNCVSIPTKRQIRQKKHILLTKKMKATEYASHHCDILFMITTRLEVRKIKNAVVEIDPKAFVFTNVIKETSGGVLKKVVKH